MSERRLVVAVTGASGFVGGVLMARLAADSRYVPRGLYRSAPTHVPPTAEALTVGDLAAEPDLGEALAGVDVVIHAAARTHVLHEQEVDPQAAYWRINVAGTAALARAAASAGVRRFVYLSSIKVNGEQTTPGQHFTEGSVPQPEDAYGRTKWEAEQALRGIGRQTGLETVILRPPLVYGPGVKGNLQRLVSLVARELPLPLGAIRNRRSLIGLDNLVSAILVVAEHRAATGQTFLVSDQHDLSTPDLLRAIAWASGHRLRLLPVPPSLLQLAGRVSGRAGEIARLTGSLEVDSSAITRALGWSPGVSVQDGIAAMVRG